MSPETPIFENAAIVTAFADQTVGTKVTDEEQFYACLRQGLACHDRSNDDVEGQHFVMLPTASINSVSAGVGRASTNPDYYVLREYRGRVTPFLRREKAAEAERVAVVVYTRAAYLADPDVMKDEAENKRIRKSDASHVIVAVLAFAGPQAPLSPYRLVHNLGGGNNEALTWDADHIRKLAGESLEYWNNWDVVAD